MFVYFWKTFGKHFGCKYRVFLLYLSFASAKFLHNKKEKH